MPEISENALMMSIQAICHVTAEHSDKRNASAGPEQADYDAIIEAYEIVAIELREVYEKTRAEDADLPAYSSLVR
jgi:hypothetical protein